MFIAFSQHQAKKPRIDRLVGCLCCLLCFHCLPMGLFSRDKIFYSASRDIGLASRRQKNHRPFAQGTEGESVSTYLYLGSYLEGACHRAVPWRKVWAELASPGQGHVSVRTKLDICEQCLWSHLNISNKAAFWRAKWQVWEQMLSERLRCWTGRWNSARASFHLPKAGIRIPQARLWVLKFVTIYSNHISNIYPLHQSYPQISSIQFS